MSERHLTRTAVFVILERHDKVFFLRRANTGWADGMLTVPAGHIDKGSTVAGAAIAETKEEAGVDILASDLEFVHVDYIRDEYVNFYFKAKNWEGETTVGEPHLASEGIWIDKNDLPEDVIPQLKRLFKMLEQQAYFSEFDREL